MVNFCCQTMFFLNKYFRNLHLFEQTTDSNEREDEQQHQSNIIATRVYLVVLTFTLIIIGIVSWLSPQVTIVTLNYARKEQLDDLPVDANCPCSRISLSYGEFISLQPIFHQVCSSDFVSDRWIEAIFSNSNSTYFNLKDFRTFGSAQAQALAGFCHLSNSNIQQNVDSFEQSSFISSQVLFETAFQQEIQSAITQFQQITPQIFSAQLELIRQVTRSNKLVSGLQTNYIISYGNPDALTMPVTYNHDDDTSCSCLSDFHCTSNAVFDNTFEAPSQYFSENMKTLHGISSGCMPANSILASTLECFYNRTCLDNLITFFPTTELFSAMPVANNSRLGPNATVQSIVDNLMVEEWITEVSYQKYYDYCAPLSCTYSKVDRYGLVFVATKLISLLSGLTLLLRLFIPIVVRFIIKKLSRVQSPKISRK